MNYFASLRLSKKLLYILSVIIAFLAVFRLGMAVGYHQGSFAAEWGSNFRYDGGFRDPRSIFMPFLRTDDDVNSHGAVGTIARVELPAILVKGERSAEQVVIISASTTIRRLSAPALATDLRSGDEIIVIGEPNRDGSISASFVRIMPESGTSTLGIPPYRMMQPKGY